MGRRIDGSRIMALLAGSGAAMVMMSMPVGLLEMLVSSTGLSEIAPAAAPPLGLTARAMVAGFAGIMTAGAALAIGQGAPGQGEEKMGFALSKLTAMARGGRRNRDGEDLPVLRRADAHPDAPARHPIFASRDFGAPDIFARPLTAVPAPEPEPQIEEEPEVAQIETIEVEEAPAVVSAEGLSLPHAPEPLSDQEITAALAARLRAPMIQAGRAPVTEALEKLSLAELAERFERGLARRKALAQAEHEEAAVEVAAPFAPPVRLSAAVDAAPVLAEIPPARPVPIRQDVDSDVEEALRAALGTLRRMTSRAG